MTTRDVAIRAEYDSKADAIYVYMLEAPVALTVSLDDRRNVDYDAMGNVVGYEFLDVSAAPGPQEATE